MGNAHVAAFVGAGSAMPFPRLRSVPLAHIARVDIRIDVGLCIRRRHSGDDCQSAQATDQSELHYLTSLSTKNCHSFYWVPSMTVKSKRQRAQRFGFFKECRGKIRVKLNRLSAAQACARCSDSEGGLGVFTASSSPHVVLHLGRATAGYLLDSPHAR